MPIYLCDNKTMSVTKVLFCSLICAICSTSAVTASGTGNKSRNAGVMSGSVQHDQFLEMYSGSASDSAGVASQPLSADVSDNVTKVTVDDEGVIILNIGKLTPVKIGPNSHTTVEVEDIPPSVTVLVGEFHVQKYNLTLSLYRDPAFTTSVTGTSGGILQKLSYGVRTATWYLHSELNETINAYLKVSSYTADDPVPGGCNQEFPLPIDPNIHLKNNIHTARVAFQYANVGTPRSYPEPDCEKNEAWDDLHYEVFQYYLDEGDFSEKTYHSALEKMTDLENIRHHAQNIESLKRGKGYSNLNMVVYQGLGVMYNVIVTRTENNETWQAMYIATSDYGCNFDGYTRNCYNLESSFLPITKVISIICAGLGLYICFMGHRFFKLQMFVFGCLAFILIFYIILTIATSLDHPIIVIIAAVFALVGGALWVGFWWCVGSPVLSELLVALVLGFLFSSIMFYTPFGLMSLWKTSLSYGMGFACGILLIPVVLLYFTKTLSIISCAVVGSYSVVFCIGLYLRCSVPYILINAIKKAVIPGFVTAMVTVPFQLFDIILVVIWIVLTIFGAVFQFYRERERPPFPPCPRTTKKHNRELQLLAEDSGAMRQPLLPEARPSGRSAGHGSASARRNYGTYRTVDADEANEIA